MQRNHKVKSHFGVVNYYTYYVDNGGTLTRTQFSNILRNINKAVSEKVLDGYVFKMPSRLGIIKLSKKKEWVGMKDGKAVTNRPIDYRATKILWDSDPEAKEQKKLVRFINKHTGGWIYKIMWDRFTANFVNKAVYTMQVNRTLKRELAKRIFEGFTIENAV